MALIEINWKPSAKELRVFGVLLWVFVAVVAWLFVAPLSTTAAITVGAFGSALAAAGLVWPRVLQPVYVVWMAAAFPIGWVVSHVLMAVVFFLVITPIGYGLRLWGRDPMERRFDRGGKSYWKARETKHDPRRYFRQF